MSIEKTWSEHSLSGKAIIPSNNYVLGTLTFIILYTPEMNGYFMEQIED